MVQLSYALINYLLLTKGSRDLILSVVRYGNVMGSGICNSVFLKLMKRYSVTDPAMTRFNIAVKGLKWFCGL